MAHLYDLLDPRKVGAVLHNDQDHAHPMHRSIEQVQSESQSIHDMNLIMSRAASKHVQRINKTHSQKAEVMHRKLDDFYQKLLNEQLTGKLSHQFNAYVQDALQRTILTMDVLRKRGDQFIEHEQSGCPPVLIYDYHVIIDGRQLTHPSNYMLLQIVPPEGIQVNPKLRPYIIIDPRAGHGPGIGGFKADSQVGVALKAGHAVYFVAFAREPVPGQHLSDVTRTEAAFVRHVLQLHPQAPRPVITGNCQGGWATMVLAATNPDIKGPIVINGAPVSPWSGVVGENPMRYNAGVLGGTWIPMLLADLGGGIFDGAHLVQNFELLNPSRTLFRKYTDLLRDVDHSESTFLEFEKWWGGFFLLNEAEIRWIVEQIFVGNRLVKNEAMIEPGRHVDLKAIQAPIIVFASHGDNITPPQQALNWITQTYADVAEIRIRGQRIVYMIHDQVGHLGIFVSSQIANKEHSEVDSTLEAIEALAPGLYEMVIDEIVDEGVHRQFKVSLIERGFENLHALDDGTLDEQPFAAVARVSEVQSQVYDTIVRPVLRHTITPTMAEMGRVLHPQRVSRSAMSSHNPMMRAFDWSAQQVKKNRLKADVGNPFLAAEALWVEGTEQLIDWMRDYRDMSYELTFFQWWGSPWMRSIGKTHETRRTLKSSEELRLLPEVIHALDMADSGGFVEAVIRMLVLLADNRGQVRRDRLQRSNEVLSKDMPFKRVGAEKRARIIHQQTLIATFDQERAISTLPSLLPDMRERVLACRVVKYIVGDSAEMSEGSLQLIHRFEEVLSLEEPCQDQTQNPLRS